MTRSYFQNAETLEPRMPLKANAQVLQTLGELVCQVDIARYGVLHGFCGTIRHPWNVLYLTGEFTQGAKRQRGVLKNQDSPQCDAVPLAARSTYFITKNVWLHFDFPRGLEIAAFHFSLESPRGLDVFDGQREIHVLRQCSARVRQLFAILERGDTEDQALRLGAMILETVAPLVGNRRDVRRLSADYAPIFELVRDDQKPLARVSVTDLAHAMDMTREHFTRSFSRDFGSPPKAFMDAHLARRAASRLSTSNAPVKVIAAEMGFGDEFHFSRFFKRHTGCSPSDYRASRGF